MRVLLIQSHLGRIKVRPPLFPLGLCYLATSLTKHQVKILDLNLWQFEHSLKTLKKELCEFNPDVTGISIRNIDTTQRFDIFYNFKTIRPTALLIKKVKPNVKQLVGGAGYSLFAKEIMERVPEFDFSIYLEGEESTPELLDHLDSPENVKGIFIRKHDRVHFTGERELIDFAGLPSPRRDSALIDIEQYIADTPHYNIGIQSKRGCIMNCGYCSYPFLTGRKLRLRSPRQIVDEIEYLIGLGVRKFSFVDNVFNIPQTHAGEICREILQRGLDVDWSAWFEIKNTTEGLLRLAQRAGCRGVGFSPDGATDQTLATLKKGITEEDIGTSINIIRKIKGLRAGYNFFCMYPGMRLGDMLKTLIFYLKIPLLLPGRGGTFMGWVRIEPHTDLYRLVLEEGFLKEDVDLLPRDEKRLKNLFYCKSSYLCFDLLIICLTRLMENILKPFIKFLLRSLRLKAVFLKTQ